MMTVGGAFQSAVNENMKLYAHALFIAVKNGLISMDDDIEDFDGTRLNEKEVLRAAEENILSMQPINLYAVPVNNFFAYYFAKKVDEVKQLHYQNFSLVATKVFDVSTKFHTDLYDPNTKKNESLVEIRKKTKVFPTLICIVPMKG